MRGSLRRFCLIATALLPLSAWAGTAVPFTINLSKPVNVVTSGGTPRIAVDVAGTTRYANYTSGSGTSALVFTYQMQAGDVDLDGVAVSSPVQLNGGTIKDLSGNPLSNLTFTPPNTAGIKVNYPSLGMDFTNGAGGRYTLNGTPYTTLASFLTAAGGSFTRASVGTYYDSAGVLQTAASGAPRLDYDPITHAAKGILIEEARTNFLVRSEGFSSNWIYHGATIATSPVNSPKGTASIRLTAKNGSYQFGIYGNSSLIPANTYTLSLYARFVNTQWVWLRGDYPNSSWAAYDIQNGVLGNKMGGVTSHSITPVGNGWYRLSLTQTSTGGANYNFVIQTGTGNTPTDNLVAYVGTEQLDIYGAQIEQGAFPTSYIPTTTAAVTRAADVLTVPTGSWFNASAGTQMANFYAPSVVSGSNRVVGYTGSGCMLCFSGEHQNWYDGNTLYSPNFVSPNVVNRAASSFVSATKATVLNGGTVATGALGSGNPIASASNFYIGSTGSGNFLNGTITKFKHYPASVPNTQLQLMTQ